MSIEERLELQACERARELLKQLRARQAEIRAQKAVVFEASEEIALIRILRDETNSKSVFDRCVALVGER